MAAAAKRLALPCRPLKGQSGRFLQSASASKKSRKKSKKEPVHETPVPARRICPLRFPQRVGHGGCILLHPGRYLLCGPGPWGHRPGGAQPGYPGLQRHPRRRAAAGHGRGHAVCHPAQPGGRPPRRFCLYPHVGYGRRGRRGFCGAGGFRGPGAGRTARRGRRDRRHDRHLPARAAAVFPGVSAQRCACLLCAQRRRAAAGHGGHGQRQPGQCRHGLYLHLPLRARHLRRGARYRVFAGHRRACAGPALAGQPPRLPPCAGAAAAAHGRAGAGARRAVLSRPVFRRGGHDHLQTR